MVSKILGAFAPAIVVFIILVIYLLYRRHKRLEIEEDTLNDYLVFLQDLLDFKVKEEKYFNIIKDSETRYKMGYFLKLDKNDGSVLKGFTLRRYLKEMSKMSFESYLELGNKMNAIYSSVYFDKCLHSEKLTEEETEKFNELIQQAITYTKKSVTAFHLKLDVLATLIAMLCYAN
jgi:hypothetical protein